jgi:nucleotidyltransferase/DNA polymerase involved in DNA repair
MDSGQELRELILDSREGFKTGLKMLDEGVAMEKALTALNTAARRQRMTQLLNEFEECRHRLRLSITTAGLDEGMSIGDIGRAFGVSRQLASRFAKEARDRSDQK